jgi:fluoride ion exporter CrcB/FEX
MLQAGHYWAFAIYIAVSVIVGILLTAAGYALSRGI